MASEQKYGFSVDFVGKQKPFFIASVGLVIACFILIFAVEPKYGIDFRGGSEIILDFTANVDADAVRSAAKATGLEDPQVQRYGPEEESTFMVQTSSVSVVNKQKIEAIIGNVGGVAEVERYDWSEEQPDRLDIRFSEAVSEEAIQSAIAQTGLENASVEQEDGAANRYVVRFQDLQERIKRGFAEAFPEAFVPAQGIQRLETVGPRVGQQLRNRGIQSILISLLLILIYIAFRFDFRYAPGAVLALFHDVTIAVGFLTITQMEISLPILAALLTIVGYSLNDTIVIFDRVRENEAAYAGVPIAAIVDRSINETLGRTLVTSFTTLLAVLAIALLGSGLIQSFAITLIVGIIAGTYSTIFVASPVMIWMDRYLQSRREDREVIKRNVEVQSS